MVSHQVKREGYPGTLFSRVLIGAKSDLSKQFWPFESLFESWLPCAIDDKSRPSPDVNALPYTTQ